MGCAKAQCLSRPMIELGKDRGEFILTDLSQVAGFGEKLAKEPVGVFVHSPFPRGIRMGQIDRRFEIEGHPDMLTESPPIGIGDRVYPCLVRLKTLGHRSPNGIRFRLSETAVFFSIA